MLAKINLNKILIFAGTVALIFIIAFFIWWHKDINVNNSGPNQAVINNQPKSPISGISCEYADKRPLAVMMSSDAITRPLSGIGQADIVFEMPVTPGGVTRMMAVFQCAEPSDIGSIRSARDAFIPLAASLDSIFAHWGGEHGALEKLNNHIIDNIDAMKYETVYFYRKPGIKQPHNGFSNFNLLMKGATDLNYSLGDTFSGYPHQDGTAPKNIADLVDEISIDYPSPLDVKWSYGQDDNSYSRTRGGEAEIDKNTGTQVKASVVIIMRTTAGTISKDYNTVDVSGQGIAEIYQNGIKITGTWKKDPAQLNSKIYFYDPSGQEIKFTPGKIWVEIVTD